RAADHVRARGQPEDREGPWPHDSAVGARPGGPGDPVSVEPSFAALEAYLPSVPGISPRFGHGHEPDGRWWVKLTIGVGHRLAFDGVPEPRLVVDSLSLRQ